MTQLKRITPEQVIEAYGTTGLKPKQKRYYSKDRTCACGIGAIFASIGDVWNDHDFPSNAAERYANIKYGYDYTQGFVQGFDSAPVGSFRSDESKQGHADGQAAWEAVKHLVEEDTNR